MPPSPNWRDRFIDLVAELCRARGEPMPPVHADTAPSLCVSLQVDGVDFEALHLDSGDECADRFLLRCRFGSIPPCEVEATLRGALEMNHELGRLQVGTFGLNEDHDELVFCTQQSLHEIDTASLLQGLRDIAPSAMAWRRQHPPMR